MLTARKLVQKWLLETESSLRGILRGFGLQVGKTTPVGFEDLPLSTAVSLLFLEPPRSALQCVRCRADQAPHQTRRGVIELDLPTDGCLRHRHNDRVAEASPLRR
jgi:hypothetical protein